MKKNRTPFTEAELMHFNQILGKKLKQLRIAKGLSQDKMSELAQLSSKYYQNIESPKIPTNLTLTTLIKISKALHIRIEDLLTITSSVS